MIMTFEPDLKIVKYVRWKSICSKVTLCTQTDTPHQLLYTDH